MFMEKSKNQLFILTNEGFEGAYEAEAFEQESDAIAKLNELMTRIQVNSVQADRKGFIDSDENQYRILPLDEAISTDGKMVWVTHQKCFDQEFLSMFDWENYFSTMKEAKDLFDDSVNLYRMMAQGEKLIRIEENTDHDQVLILVKAIPRVLIEYHARPIGEITNEGTLLLNKYLN